LAAVAADIAPPVNGAKSTKHRVLAYVPDPLLALPQLVVDFAVTGAPVSGAEALAAGAEMRVYVYDSVVPLVSSMTYCTLVTPDVGMYCVDERLQLAVVTELSQLITGSG
jgi:hypothetical protein